MNTSFEVKEALLSVRFNEILISSNEKQQVIKTGDNEVVRLSPFVILPVPPSMPLMTKLIAPSLTHALHRKVPSQAAFQSYTTLILTKSIRPIYP